MTPWTPEEKRIIKEFENVIKGNEAIIMAMCQASPYMRLTYSPNELQKLLNSLKDKNFTEEDAPLLEGRIGVEIHDKEKGRIMLRLPKLDFVIRPDTARRLTVDLLKVMRDNNIIQSPQDQEDEGKDTRICACCKRNLPEDVEICFQCVIYNRFKPKEGG